MKNIEIMSNLFDPTNYEHLVKNHYDAICIMNLEGSIIYANDEISAMFGYFKEEMLELKDKKFVCAEELGSFFYYRNKAIEGESHEFDLAINAKDGNKVELKARIGPNEIDGEIVNISLSVKDMTSESNGEMKQLIHNDICVSFIENNRDPILLLDLNATIVLANRSFSKLLGWRKENLEGFHILKCPSIPPHLVQQMRDYYERVISQESSDLSIHSDLYTLETIRVSNDDQSYHMMLSFTPIHDVFGEVCNWAVHLRDITRQKEAEASLLRAEKLLSIGQLAAGVTHEIRNPLQSLKGLTQLIKNTREDAADYDHYIDVMIDELNQMETFVNDFSLLARTKLDSYKKTDMSYLLHEIINSLKSQTIINNVHIELEYDDQLPSILCEERLLKQAIFNVVQNGIEAMESGGTLHIRMNSLHDRMEIHVIDHGIGITDERYLKLGEPFYSNNEKGFGLGLMLTYKIIEQHRGTVTIQSNVGQGTHVTISFPIN